MTRDSFTARRVNESGVFDISWAEQEHRKFERQMPEKRCPRNACGKEPVPGYLYCWDHARIP